MDRGLIAAARAHSALGAPFAVNGCSVAGGFDCVGLALYCYGLPTDTTPRRMGLARVAPAFWLSALADAGFTPTDTARTGDLLLLDCGRGRLHLGIQVERGLVHAHAGLRRVVHAATPAPMILLARYSHP